MSRTSPSWSTVRQRHIRCRRSGPRSRPDTIGQSADDDTFVAVARHRSELQHPAPDRFIGDVEPGGGDRRASGHESKEYRRGMLNRPIYRHLRGGPVPRSMCKRLAAFCRLQKLCAGVWAAASGPDANGLYLGLRRLGTKSSQTLRWRGESRANQSLKWVSRGPGN